MVKHRFSEKYRPNKETDNLKEPVSADGIAQIFSQCGDLERRRIRLGGDSAHMAELFFIDGLVTAANVGELVVRPLTSSERLGTAADNAQAAEMMLQGLVYACTARRRETISDTVQDMLRGFCAVVPDGCQIAVTFEVKSKDNRSVGQPNEEKVIKGSKDAFVETMRTNTGLARRKIRDPHLKVRQFTIGEKTGSTAAVIYIEGFTNTGLVDEVCRRVSSIKAQGALTSSVIEENIVDNPRTPFPQLINTERVDKFCMNILEGRVGIIVDGIPLGYLAPGTFTQFLKVPEDHSEHFLIASALTLLRYFSLTLTLLLPAFYVAIAMYHQEMLPTRLMQSMIEAKQAVPFPTAVEVVMMLVAFELLQEAGLRLPNPVGQTVSIIGALIVGQSAVEARVVSPVVVVVIALAGISGYTMPSQDMGSALRICRFLLVLSAIALGMFGLAIGCTLLIYHLASLNSFGVPYMTPFAGAQGRFFARALFRISMRKKEARDPTLGTGK